MRVPLPLVLIVIVTLVAPLLAATADGGLQPSIEARAALKDLAVQSLDPARTAVLAARVDQLFATIESAQAVSVDQRQRAFDATWVVAACWKKEVFDQRMHLDDVEDRKLIADFYANPEAVHVLRTRLVIIRKEYETYAEALGAAMTKAGCPQERRDSILTQLTTIFGRQRILQREMSESPLWWGSLAQLTTSAGAIADTVVEPEYADPQPASPPNWADRVLIMFPLVLDQQVSTAIAAAVLAFDADRTIMCLSAL